MIKPQKGRNLITWGATTRCMLYDTMVAIIETMYDPEEYFTEFHHGGWVTRATCKAINAALESHGLASWHCFIKDGFMYVSPGASLEPIEVLH